MNSERLKQVVLLILAVPLVGVSTGLAIISHDIVATDEKVLAQSADTSTEPAPAETPAEPEEPAEPAPAEAAETASNNINWPILGGVIVALVIAVALVASLSRRPDNKA